MVAVTTLGGVAATRMRPVRFAAPRPLAAAWAVVVTVTVLTAAALFLHLVNGSTELTSWWYGNLVDALALGSTGALIVARRPANAVGRLMCLSALASATCFLGREYLVYGLLGHGAPGWHWLGWLADSLFAVTMIALPMILMLLPDGRAMSRRAGRLLWLPALALVLTSIDFLFAADAIQVRGRQLASPSPIRLPTVVTDAASTVGELLFFVSLVAGIVIVVVRYRRSVGATHEQLTWIVWAGSIALAELATEVTPMNPIAPVTGTITMLFLTAAIAVAILRHRLFDVDVVVNRTLVYGALTVLVVGGYVGVVTLLDASVGRPVRLGPGVLATALVAAAFAPARQRVQRGVDRVLYGERNNPYGVLTQLGRRMEQGERRGELSIVVDTITQALKLPYAAIVEPAGGLLAESGRRDGDVVTVPLTHRGEPVGALLVAARSVGTPLGAAEQRLLGDLSGQVGVAVHAVRLAGDLQDSRRRLVTAKEEERRRLRRDLHDGLGPKLAAVGLQLDAARSLVADDPDRVQQTLVTVKAEIRATLEDVRRLVYDLRPPALDELGLVGAVRDCAARLEPASGPIIAVHAPAALAPLPAAVEVAAYRIVNEALTNVVRHAQARRCDVRLHLEGDVLAVTVRDDGVGAPNDCRSGVGTQSMAERAAEIGGSFQMDGNAVDGRGTTVTARLPLGRGDA
jgi:signal transduction histidine kinase